MLLHEEMEYQYLGQGPRSLPEMLERGRKQKKEKEEEEEGMERRARHLVIFCVLLLGVVVSRTGLQFFLCV